MVEVRVEVRITERNAQRIRVIRHRKELRSRRLCRTSEIEETDMRVIIELVVQHCLRRPVHHLAVVGFVSRCLIVCVCRIALNSELEKKTKQDKIESWYLFLRRWLVVYIRS